MNSENRRRIAIVGMGPRGLTALERLLQVTEPDELTGSIAITLIEEDENQLGNSHVYSLDQPETNWINISARDLQSMPGRPEVVLNGKVIGGFPDYVSWSDEPESYQVPVERDIYCPRSHMGRYLRERFDSLFQQARELIPIELQYGAAESVSFENERFTICLENGQAIASDEVLLTIGHQSTKRSDQLKEWLEHAKKYEGLHAFAETYPIENLMRKPEIYHGTVVGIRGFGLAMIDVVRALTIGRGGTFEIENEETRKMKYIPSGREPELIIPFSLDGLPPASKPLNAQVDSWFEPKDIHSEKLRKVIRSAISNKETVQHAEFLRRVMAAIVSEIYDSISDRAIPHDLKASSLEDLVYKWLTDQDTSHPLITPDDQSARVSMEAFADMSVGKQPVSLDYCVGQVWRHLQPLMYEEFAFCGLHPEVMSEIVELDERIKRYSYGVPVDSLRQLIALIDADMLTVDLVDDPDIEKSKKGWHLSKGSHAYVATIMIDSVLDGPVLEKIDTPVINQLREHKLIQPFHENLGVLTTRNGSVITKEMGAKIPLAITGRLAKGVLLGTDAILECFSDPVTWWAEGVAARLKNP